MIEGMKKTFENMGSRFDSFFSEKSLLEDGTVQEVLDFFKERDLIYEKDGAIWFKVSSFIDEDDKVLIRKDGTLTYFMTDIAYHYKKKQRGFERVYDIWGSDHHGHIPRMKAAMKALGFPDDFLTVILHQFVTLKKEGKILRMSTRAGRFITLDELLNEVGRDATRYFFARIDPSKPLEFDMDLAVKKSMDNPVYYVQYAHARISSLFKQAKEKGVNFNMGSDLELLGNEYERKVMKQLDLFEDVLVDAALSYSPAKLTTYLEELAHSFHIFYTHNTVVDTENPELSNARLNLSKAVQIVIKKGLNLIGVSAPERM
jgi:arginyl-tRNA synthetase